MELIKELEQIADAELREFIKKNNICDLTVKIISDVRDKSLITRSHYRLEIETDKPGAYHKASLGIVVQYKEDDTKMVKTFQQEKSVVIKALSILQTLSDSGCVYLITQDDSELITRKLKGNEVSLPVYGSDNKLQELLEAETGKAEQVFYVHLNPKNNRFN